MAGEPEASSAAASEEVPEEVSGAEEAEHERANHRKMVVLISGFVFWMFGSRKFITSLPFCL